MGCGGERRAVGKTGLGSLQYTPTRSDEPWDRSQGTLGARYAPRQTLPHLRWGRVGKGLKAVGTYCVGGSRGPYSSPIGQDIAQELLRSTALPQSSCVPSL